MNIFTDEHCDFYSLLTSSNNCFILIILVSNLVTVYRLIFCYISKKKLQVNEGNY